jgi:hypothetical protein
MFLFKYLDLLPPIPVEFLLDPIPDFSESNIGYSDDGSGWSNTYTRWGINQDLTQWLQAHISSDVKMSGVQIMSWDESVLPGERKVNPHCDYRKWALNYVYETGGENVATSFYCEKDQRILRDPGCRIINPSSLTALKTVVIEPNRWHIINTNVLHGVSNVETTRKAVTIGLNHDDPFSVIYPYRDSIQ